MSELMYETDVAADGVAAEHDAPAELTGWDDHAAPRGDGRAGFLPEAVAAEDPRAAAIEQLVQERADAMYAAALGELAEAYGLEPGDLEQLAWLAQLEDPHSDPESWLDVPGEGGDEFDELGLSRRSRRSFTRLRLSSSSSCSRRPATSRSLTSSQTGITGREGTSIRLQ